MKYFALFLMLLTGIVVALPIPAEGMCTVATYFFPLLILRNSASRLSPGRV